MNLYQNLAKIRHDFESGETPREIIDVLNGHIEELLASDVTKNAISVGEIAPLESMVQSKTESVPLSNLFGKHFLVLTWFRGSW